MGRRIELRAIVARDGELLAFRRQGEAWQLPGGALDDGEDDIDAAMDSFLRARGIAAENVAEAFLRTDYADDETGPAVVNLYALADWAGEPSAGDGEEHGWLALDTIETAGLHATTLASLLIALGVQPERDVELPGALGGTSAAPQQPADRHLAGLDVLRTLRGGAVDPAQAYELMLKNTPELAGDVVDFALGEVWSHPALDRHTRSLLVVAMLSAMGGRGGALRSHLNGALNHGATPEEIVQLMRMVAVYAGFPVALEGWAAMEETFAARGIPRPRQSP
jgi:4-carboxymuconolactone decarboxylase